MMERRGIHRRDGRVMVNSSVVVNKGLVTRLLDAGFSQADAFIMGVPLCIGKGRRNGLRFRHKYGKDQLRLVPTYYELEKIIELRTLGYTDAEAWEAGAEALIGYKKTQKSPKGRGKNV